jgi:hypothetical protein
MREEIDMQFQTLAAGGRDNGAPGERSYQSGLLRGVVLDPDGNNVNAVVHGPLLLSADSVSTTAGWVSLRADAWPVCDRGSRAALCVLSSR